MEIQLRNGMEVNLEISSLTFEYLEDYEGGLEKLKKDAQSSKNKMIAVNHLLYSIICSNIDEPLTYRQAIRLVDVKDIERIISWIIREFPENSQNIKNNSNKHRFN